MKKWGHHVVLSVKGGRTKASCTGCGWQTRWLEDRDQAVSAGRAHTHLVEKERPPDAR